MTSKAYLAAPETPIVFTASGGDVAWTVDGITTLAGRQSAQHDFGDAARAFMYRWRAKTQWDTQPVVGESLDFYYKSSDGTILDNDDGTGDIALSAADKLKNLHYIGSIIVDEAIIDTPSGASGVIAIYERYIHIVAFNNSVDTISTTANDTSFTLTPLSIQGQAT